MDNGNPSENSAQINQDSLQLLFSITQNEYSNEHERTTTIDSKAGIALPIITTYFMALAQMNDYKAIIAIPIQDFYSSWIPVVLFVSYTIGLIMAFVAVVFMARVIFTREYCKINPIDLYTDENLTNEHINFSIKLLHRYFKAIEHNRKANGDKIKLYKRSWLFSFISVVCFVIYILISNNV